MNMRFRTAGFTLLPVIMAMTLVAAVAFLLNRSNALNANVVSTRSDVERARYAAEAGLQAANYVIQQTGCAGGYPTSSTPVVDTAFGGSAYSAYASSISGSPLTLTSTGTHNGATVTLTRTNVYVYQTGVRSYAYQPNPALGADTFVDASNSGTNHGASSELAIGGSGFESLLRFDLSFFPAGSRVVPWYDTLAGVLKPGAVFQIYKKTSGTTTTNPAYVDAHLITRTAWVEGDGSSGSGATWNHYDGINPWPSGGSRYDVRPIFRSPLPGAAGWQRMDFSDVARAWMGPVYTNSGVWLRSSPAGDPVPSSRYVSSDDTSLTSQRPRLDLSYLLPCGATAPPPPVGVVLTLYPVADGFMTNAAPADSFGSSTSLSVFDNGSEIRRTLLRFDMSAVPTGQLLQSATLRLESTAMANASTSAKAISAHTIMEGWSEGTTSSPGAHMSWNSRNGVHAWSPTAGGTYRLAGAAMAADEHTRESPPPSTFTTGGMVWNVRGLVQEWVDGMTTNNGLILVSTVRDNPTLVAREGTLSQRPRLVITY